MACDTQARIHATRSCHRDERRRHVIFGDVIAEEFWDERCAEGGWSVVIGNGRIRGPNEPAQGCNRAQRAGTDGDMCAELAKGLDVRFADGEVDGARATRAVAVQNGDLLDFAAANSDTTRRDSTGLPR